MDGTVNRRILWIAVAAAVLVGFGAGLWFGGGSEEKARSAPGADEARIWTCSMHPQIQQPEPGDCPICGMDLIPLASDGGEALGPRQLRMSEAARQLAQVQVHPVERRIVERLVRMVGNVTFDETRLATITAWVGGRLDRLYVDYTGIAVSEGDHMVWMYSPDVLAAQEELLQAKRAVDNLGDASRLVLESAQATLAATRDRLRLWGLTSEQIAAIEARGTATDQIQINAPIGGIVVQKNAQQGEYVQTGTPIYRIADLTQVWVKLDAYESDLSWLRFGQAVEFETEAYPGEIFSGRISFIDPVLTERTRTVKVRVNVPNERGSLKPGMFVRAKVQAKVAAGGKVIDEDMADKWICPMHPEVMSDDPDDCTICGMPLRKAEELGYVSTADLPREIPLVIPASAPLITGKRAVVYVQDPDDASIYSGREVVLGPRAGDYYLVSEGLAEGELVVTRGNFKIDSALQIQAKPSMMNPPPEVVVAPEPERLAVDATFTDQLQMLFAHYLQMQETLAADNLANARGAASALAEAVTALDASMLDGQASAAWTKDADAIAGATGKIAASDAIDAARVAFEPLSMAMIDVAKRFGSGHEQELLVMHCPMAFDDKGADWLQLEPAIANPYFGSMMFRCGEIASRIPPAGAAAPAEAAAADELPAAFHESFSELLDAYIEAQIALSRDTHEPAVAAARSFIEKLDAIDMAALPEAPHMRWMTSDRELRRSAGQVAAGQDIEASRKAFALLSESMTEAVRRFGGGLEGAVYKMSCPMAFNDRGALWLQRERELVNPYFGAMMYRCGEIAETLRAPGKGDAANE